MPNDDRRMTDAELELMDPLWDLHEASVREVLEALPEDRKRAYTSVSTILRILEQKGFVRSRKEGRKHLYQPLVSREDYGSRSVHHLVKEVYRGDASELLRQLVRDDTVDDDTLRALSELVDARLGGQG